MPVPVLKTPSPERLALEGRSASSGHRILLGTQTLYILLIQRFPENFSAKID